MQRGSEGIRVPRRRFWAAGLGLTVLGTGLIGAVFHLNSQDHAFRSHGSHARVTILRVQQAPDHRSNHTLYLLRFEPSAHLPDEWTNGVSGDVGSTLDVIYDPSEPTHVEPATGGAVAHWVVRILLGSTGTAALAGAALALHGEPRRRS
ncbi:DUF3592 domain-containing protein [Kitasatospora sp. NPDC058965]|uniref:DUF3592 domain-containing protein n=1 Tax=Kitasatospora sp. NPDC058965 TaxID=3346682 RepID=UPI0036B10D84